MNKDHLKTALICLALAVGTAVLYAPVLHFDFLKYDDQLYVVNNPHVNTGLSPANLGWAFQAGYAGNWHPLTWISLMLDCQLFGMKAGGYHATNVLLHALNAVLLFLALRSLTGAIGRSAIVAALFAWHPLHVESVAWVADRKDVLSASFWMLTLWAYARYVHGRRSPAGATNPAQAGAPGNPRPAVFYSLAVIFFALGLMAKPMLVTLPCVLLLLDWWPLGRFKSAAATTSGTAMSGNRLLPLLVEKVPFFALAIISSVMTIIAQNGDAITADSGAPLEMRAINALATLTRYIEKTVWPSDLGAIYPFIGHWSIVRILVALAGVLVVTLFAIRCMSTRGYWLAGWLWFLGALIPVLGIFQFGSRPMADRYTYIPLIGLFLIAVWDSFDIARRWRSLQWVSAAVFAAVLVALFVASSHQLGYWQNTETLLSHVARSDMNAMGHAEYAALLMSRNRLPLAQTECEQALRIAPGSGLMHALLGRILFLEGKQPQAVAELHAALKAEPGLLEARVQLGKALLAEKLPKEAAAEFQTVLKSLPNNAEARLEFGKALAMMRDFDTAAIQFNEALRLQPQYPEAHFFLGLLLGERHKNSDAMAHYQAALRLRPDYPDALNNLAWILATTPSTRNGAQAVQLAQRACQLTRDAQPEMIGTLAAAYAATGRFDEAVATAQKAHDLAVARGETNLASTNLRLRETYRAHQTVNVKE